MRVSVSVPGATPRRSRHRNALISAPLRQERANRPRTVPASAPRQAAPGGQRGAGAEPSAGTVAAHAAATDEATAPSAPAPSVPTPAPAVAKTEDAGKHARAAEALEARATNASPRAGRLPWCLRTAATGAEARPATAVAPGDGRWPALHSAHRPQTADAAAAGGRRRTLRLRGGTGQKPSPRPGRDLLANNRPQTGRAVPVLSEERQQQREAVQRWRLEKQERDAKEAALREQKAREAAEAWALRVRACRAQLLLLKSQSASTKPAPALVLRPPPEALVRLDRTREAHALLREQFVADLSAVKGLDSIAIPVIPVVPAVCATRALPYVLCAMWNMICRVERESRSHKRREKRETDRERERETERERERQRERE